MQKPRRLRTFKSYIAEKYPDGEPIYDEIADMDEWIRFIKSIKARQLRIRYLK
jgi:hypothetical protein